MAKLSPRPIAVDRDFALLFTVMLTVAAGNTALQSVLPALGRSLAVPDWQVAAAFSVSALLWVIAAPIWARRSDRQGRKAMILLGLAGFSSSLILCGVVLAAGINGVISGTAAFLSFILGRLIYGSFGAAAPPAVQALVAGKTSRDDRTKALTLLASATGLGTIMGPALAPYLLLPDIGPVRIGLAGPAFVGAAFGLVVMAAVYRYIPNDGLMGHARGAAVAYPSIGNQPSGASVTAATAHGHEQVGYRDPRVRAWMIAGLVMGHAQAMTGQAIGFLVIDRLHLSSAEALPPTGLVLIMGAGASLLAQWGLIPLLNLDARRLVLAGLVASAIGTAATGMATSLYGIALGYSLASLGFGFTRPGFTAGASLAVGAKAQGSVAGKVTSINGASFVLGPSIGVGLYQLARPRPYRVAAAALVAMLAYAWVTLSAPAAEAAPES
ncbi:MAG: MFS transporter [Sphingomonas sp.]